ncbi:MAG: AbrB/MazE/SpoVT family DNA-binding domain-containing protein [Clostridia bacterium]|nr:AbrB/MazE/SpoVT family DNA-binding domain-containing protein [Clostridia bacterium]
MAGPNGKHIFGTVKVGEKGQIVIPKEARKIFNINPGDSLMILGDEAQGLAIVKSEDFLHFAKDIFNAKEIKEDEE